MIDAFHIVVHFLSTAWLSHVPTIGKYMHACRQWQQRLFRLLGMLCGAQVLGRNLEALITRAKWRQQA